MKETVDVAIVGGGCAAVAAAFELTRPEHGGRYRVTLYQVGWRLGGKGASGRRGPSQRIEEHGLHVWLGYYENAFRLLRECYTELDRDPAVCPISDCFQAFEATHLISLADDAPDGSWRLWSAQFPATSERPGDPFEVRHPFTLRHYLSRAVQLLRTLLASARDTQPLPKSGQSPLGDHGFASRTPSPDGLTDAIGRLLRLGSLASLTALIEALNLLENALGTLSAVAGSPTQNLLNRLIDLIATSFRSILGTLLDDDLEMRRIWCLVDLVLAFLRGSVRFGLASDPRGLDALDDFDCVEWLRLNGASETALRSTFVRSLYDLGFSYDEADPQRPRMSAGQGLRGALRMFFTYRGAVFWKMRAGMGDVVFAPYYEVLRRRGVQFRFFHRLEDVKLSPEDTQRTGERPHVEALEFSVQAEVLAGADGYEPLIDVDGLPCWPAEPDWRQLKDGEAFRRAGRDFESHWDPGATEQLTLRVGRDFDCVVLGVGLGAIPYVCGEILQRDARWRAMVDRIGTVATQAFQLWLNEDMQTLGWRHGSGTLSGFVEPFDTWADMDQLRWTEQWPGDDLKAIAYFCNVLPTPEGIPPRRDADYPAAKYSEVRRNALRFIAQDLGKLWPNATHQGRFRWPTLVDHRPSSGDAPDGPQSFDSQFWTANVNPSDRYVLSLPGTSRYRISPLDNTYDNLTLAGDWTQCGHNHGCVEAATMSGRLAAHAISGHPRLVDIIGYDHP